MAVGRDTEIELRKETERARQRLVEIDNEWRRRGLPTRGRIARNWQKRRLDFLKAIDAENNEYEATLGYRDIDPDDDAAITAFLAGFRRYLRRVEQAMGLALVLTGIAFLTGSINTMSVWLLEMFPVLGRIG